MSTFCWIVLGVLAWLAIGVLIGAVINKGGKR